MKYIYITHLEYGACIIEWKYICTSCIHRNLYVLYVATSYFDAPKLSKFYIKINDTKFEYYWAIPPDILMVAWYAFE